MANAHYKPLQIGVIVFEAVMQLDFIGVTSYLEILPAIANVPVQFHTISLAQGNLLSSGGPVSGVPLYASVGYQDAPQSFDIFLIPGGRGRINLVKDQGILDYIRTAAEQSTHVLTVCTGSGILARTGFLDGKNATTNKLTYDEIVGASPSVNWIRKARWVVDGKIWTSSGVSAGMDMAYAYIAQHYGSETADKMARYIETVPNKDPSNDPFA
jgi:transcriptional regulator GlxA family with amidase domain|uniref:DJ-1/PfpI domain-containing protein n=1 Tax=Globisporangium ultimum (strain ATCC 200006 / CBS 805.95 / DAOM BR144) TaxID=431595 RepID=K3X968_GLOUD